MLWAASGVRSHYLHDILVVGAGLAGAVCARELADAGFDVHVIDKRTHIGGNCFDYMHDSGVRIHKYGPHLFHTSNMKVVDWLSRFTEWTPYEHRVVARLPDQRLVPLPINLDTISAVFNTSMDSPGAVASLLASKAVRRDPVMSAEDHLYSTIGPELTNLFFRPYSLKMWGMDLSNMSAAVVRRLEIRMDQDDRYFPNDRFQALPKEGYTRMFERILDHDRIQITLGEAFCRSRSEQYDFCFTSMPIDEYYDFSLGELPYRSIKFLVEDVPASEAPNYAVVNYTDSSDYTRETWWHMIGSYPAWKSETTPRTIEFPCDYKDNDFERYYPVKTSDNRYDALYRCYAEYATQSDHIAFIGRCGTYRYLDMHQVVNQTLGLVAKWLDRISHGR